MYLKGRENMTKTIMLKMVEVGVENPEGKLCQFKDVGTHDEICC